jgi:hypothetical protein
MTDVRLIDANALLKKLQEQQKYSSVSDSRGRAKAILEVIDAPTIDAQPVKHGHWSECYRDCRCISVICSVCKNPTAIGHGCRDADEVTMDYVIERLPHCPKCCSDMRGDADER